MTGSKHGSRSPFVRLLALVVFAGTLIWCSENLYRHPRVWADPSPFATVPPPSATILPNANKVYMPLVAKPDTHTSSAPTNNQRIVFVSRQILPHGSIYWDKTNDLPGVGPYSRFRNAAPSQLIIRETNGDLTILLDGSHPTAASFNLIDVNAPDVSYDATQIVFAGLPSGNYQANEPLNNPNAWRLYAINVDGSHLRQLTFTDEPRQLSQFGDTAGVLTPYDDTDPAWLPDGRIVFSSTRWPEIAQYSAARSSNLYVVNADGQNLHRITAERNGADRPLIDPVTGKIVFARWWRNHRFVAKTMETIPDPNGGYIQYQGLTADRTNQYGGPDFLWRNLWQATTINPDGTQLALWTGDFRLEDVNFAYGGAFTAAGDLIANYFPMFNMTEAAGFGGLRRYQRGANHYQAILGVTSATFDYVSKANPTSFGIYKGSYATDAAVLPDNNLIISYAKDITQDYGLYLVNADGSQLTPFYDQVGTSELRAKVLKPRPLPPIIEDTVTQTPSLLPPTAAGPYDTDGTFVFAALNVYFNAPVDVDMVNAPVVGSATTMRFFLDHQRTSYGSFGNLDWPILLKEAPIAPDGSMMTTAPANLPLFEEARAKDGTVPFTVNSTNVHRQDGAAHVAGMNYGRPGTTVRCVGCHAGHSMLPVPANDADAQWTNLAPSAAVLVSSTRDPALNEGLTDRLASKGSIGRYWNSDPNQPANGQWLQLTFPVPISVRTVRLYNPRFGEAERANVQIHRVTVHVYSDAAGTIEVGHATLQQDLAVTGTDITFADIQARVVKVVLDNVTGTLDGKTVAALAEIEVIARGEE